MLQPKIACYAVYESTEEGWEAADTQLAALCADLAALGMQVHAAGESVKDEASCSRVAAWACSIQPDLLVALIITWSFDHFSYLIWQQTRVPVAIRCVPGIRTGSMVGAQQLGALFTDLGLEYRLFYGALGDRDCAMQMYRYARATAAVGRLRGLRVAMLGRRTPGMTPIAFDEIEIMRLFGTTVTTIGMDEFDATLDSIPETEIVQVWERVNAEAEVNQSTRESGLAATRVYLGIKRLVSEYGFGAVTVGSYPQCQGTACLAISLLNDEGIVAGCEGDMNATIAMYLLSLLTDAPVHFGEILDMDKADNTIISSHCGAAAKSLADCSGFQLCPVRLAHRGVCVRFSAKPGPVTYVNLVGRKQTYRLCAFEGVAQPAQMVFEGNPMKIQMACSLDNLWEAISTHGFSHHWLAAYGQFSQELAEICRMIGIKGVFPGKER